MKKTITPGQRLREAREEANLSQLELALLCGWSTQGRISHYENDIRELRNSVINTLCKALKIDPRWLQFGDKK